MVLGLGLKFPRPSSDSKGAEEDEQWYIPYNGPYEPPRASSRRTKARDSWGDPIGDEEDHFSPILVGIELQQRFGAGDYSTRDHVTKTLEGGRVIRDRTTSFASGRTGSSGAIDPNHGSVVTQRRSTVSSGQRPLPPPNIHVEAGGGVGESPAPHISTKESHHPHRLSLGSIFSFNPSSKKGLASPHATEGKEPRKSSFRKSRPTKLTSGNKEPSKLALRMAPGSSSSSDSSSPRKFPDPDISGSTKVDDDDYYNTYYSTLLKGPGPEISHHNPSFGVNPRIAPRPGSGSVMSHPETSTPHYTHPYAYTFTKQDPDSLSHDIPFQESDPSKLTFGSAKPSRTKPPPSTRLGLKQLKNSTSTPNLHPPTEYRARGIERWLSAETWCDAILFPRPRLKVKEEPSSDRIISPPTTPITDEYASKTQGKAPTSAYTSRVLAHSHSLIDLSVSKRHRPFLAPEPVSSTRTNGEKEPRPKSFAQDDLALIHPVLSLEQVLEDGELLESQRKQWKLQASSSIGNARARSLSRTRSKSLTQKGRLDGHRNQTSYDYLAARACFGNQNLTPIIIPPRSQTTSFSDATTTGRTSHTHSNSIAKSKSSKSHSRGHSRSDSHPKSGSKHKGSVGDPNANSEIDDKLLGLEGALRRDDVKAQRGLKPTFSAETSNQPRISPTPSGGSDIRMGIAISTPPLVDDTLIRETIRMPTHPYARAGASQVTGKHAVVGSHEQTSYVAPASTRFASSHPYALASENDDEDSMGLIGYGRSNARPQSKMWAQISPGFMREVLPSELQYSPFLPEQSSTPSPPADRTDVVGMGEALAYSSYRNSPDSGLGTSEGHVIQPYVPSASPLGMREYQPDYSTGTNRPHREPVQYDATQPTYAYHHHRHKSSLDQANLNLILSNTDRFPIPELRPPPLSHSLEVASVPPRTLGSPNDLESFQDLFYRPQGPGAASMGGGDTPYGSSVSGPLTGEIAIRTRRTGSGLTSLARQLSEEFEQMERERSNSQYSHSSGSNRPSKRLDGSLQFVFENVPRSASPLGEEDENDQDSTQIFKPSFNIPEDVHSSASSLVERMPEQDEDETTMFRVGLVESVSTPPTEETTRRRSYTGLMSGDVASPTSPISNRHLSALLSPTEMTRSSYMTTSTTSRMSNLSDFPIPPKHEPLPPANHLSFLSSYHHSDETTLNHQELETLRDTPHPMEPHDRRFTFGVDQDAVDVADSLSNPDH